MTEEQDVMSTPEEAPKDEAPKEEDDKTLTDAEAKEKLRKEIEEKNKPKEEEGN